MSLKRYGALGSGNWTTVIRNLGFTSRATTRKSTSKQERHWNFTISSFYSQSSTKPSTRHGTGNTTNNIGDVANPMATVLDLSSLPKAAFDATIGEGKTPFPPEEAQTYFYCANKYVVTFRKLLATKKPVMVRDTNWPQRLGLPVEQIYDTSCALIHLGMPQSGRLSHAMCLSAAMAGHVPAILTMALTLPVEPAEYNRVNIEIRKPFEKIVQQGRNANAIYLHGRRLHLQSQYLAAEMVLTRALTLHGGTVFDEDPSSDNDFEWRAECQRFLAKTYLALGKREDALRLLQTVVLAADPSSAHLELGLLRRQEGDHDQAIEHFLKTRLRSEPKVAKALAVSYYDKAQASDGSKLKLEYLRLSEEWSRVAAPESASRGNLGV